MNAKKAIISSFLFTFLMISSSCSSAQSITPMEKRTYDMCVNSSNKPTCDGFCYQDNVCVKKVLGICINKEIRVVDKIEMTIPENICNNMFQNNLIMKVRDIPL